MKPIEQIRRDNLHALVGAESSQAAFARKIHKDKNQVSQWLGRAGARNLSAETARDIEKVCGKPSGWMDHDRTPTADGAEQASSQPAGLDGDKLRFSIDFVERQFDLWGLDYSAADRSMLIAGVYMRLAATATPNTIELGRWLADKVTEKVDVGQSKTGSAGSDDRSGNEGVAAKAKAKAGRAG